MAVKSNYFVLKEKAIPEVLLKVVKAKRLIDTGKAASVQEAADAVGISRSSFYKYKDDIFPFHDNSRGMTVTMIIQMDDEPGLLSEVLKSVADYHANVLTIHQSIPVNGCAVVTMTAETSAVLDSLEGVLTSLSAGPGVIKCEILAG